MNINYVQYKLTAILLIPLILSFSNCAREVKKNQGISFKVDTLKFQLDTFFTAKIDTSEVKIYVLRKKLRPNGDNYNLANDSGSLDAPISFIVTNMNGDSLFYQNFVPDSAEWQDDVDLEFYKRRGNSLSTPGYLFYSYYYFGGGAYGPVRHTIFLVRFKEGNLYSTEICDFDSKSTVVHSNTNDSEFLFFQGLDMDFTADEWGQATKNGYYKICNYKITNCKITQNSIQKTELGETKHKYHQLNWEYDLVGQKNIILEMNRKEPALFKNINLNDY